MMFGLLLREAIHSCAIEHREHCDCDICKAADGDIDAFARVWAGVQGAQSKRDAEANPSP